jgi:hypothetical protein
MTTRNNRRGRVACLLVLGCSLLACGPRPNDSIPTVSFLPMR